MRLRRIESEYFAACVMDGVFTLGQGGCSPTPIMSREISNDRKPLCIGGLLTPIDGVNEFGAWHSICSFSSGFSFSNRLSAESIKAVSRLDLLVGVHHPFRYFFQCDCRSRPCSNLDK